jgi:hypothetical protein
MPGLSSSTLAPEPNAETTWRGTRCAFGKVIRRELHGYLVTREDADVVHPHLSGDVPENHVSVFELDAKRRIRRVLNDLPLHFNDIFLGHKYLAGESAPLKFAFLSKLSYWCDMT